MLADLLLQVAVVVGVMLVVAMAAIVGRYRLRATLEEWPDRLRAAGPIGLVLGVVLLVNRQFRQQAPDIEQAVGQHITEAIIQLEGDFILLFQSIASDELNMFFSFIYIYGYTFILLFPVIAYFTLSNTRPLRELLTAYTINYAIGLICYIVFIAFGPRNYYVDLVEATMLYDSYPTYQYLTSEVNRNTNVFPSLHASLATTVAIFAVLTRDVYPKWVPIAIFLAASVSLSTMYLAIHWAIDVLAGIVLAGISVPLARYLVGRYAVSERIGRHLPRVGGED